jgi:opacity protein-like surface antigen
MAHHRHRVGVPSRAWHERSRMIRRILVSGLIGVVFAVAPRPARADGYFVPYYGKITGAPREASRTSDPAGFGGSFGYMRGGIFGFETDISFSPDFFGDSDSVLIGDNSMTTWMGNVIVGIPFGGQQGFGVRPYGVAGFGGFRQRLESITGLIGFSNTNWGYDVGGGVFVYFTSHVGVRGDVRYFKTTFNVNDLIDLVGIDFDLNGDEVDVDFTRYTIGLSLRW